MVAPVNGATIFIMKYLFVIFILLQTGRSTAQSTFSRLYNMADTAGVGSGAHGMLVDDSFVYLVGNYFNHLSFKIEN